MDIFWSIANPVFSLLMAHSIKKVIWYAFIKWKTLLKIVNTRKHTKITKKEEMYNIMPLECIKYISFIHRITMNMNIKDSGVNSTLEKRNYFPSKGYTSKYSLFICLNIFRILDNSLKNFPEFGRLDFF